MKKKRKFLLPLAALAAAFTTEQAVANVAPEPLAPQDDAATAADSHANGDRVFANNGQDQFSFVLKRGSAGQLMAWHESHYSHYSHDSHSSHSSHYSGY